MKFLYERLQLCERYRQLRFETTNADVFFYSVGELHKGMTSLASASAKAKSSGPVLLVRKRKQTAQVILHSTVAAAAFTFCLWRLWKE